MSDRTPNMKVDEVGEYLCQHAWSKKAVQLVAKLKAEVAEVVVAEAPSRALQEKEEHAKAVKKADTRILRPTFNPGYLMAGYRDPYRLKAPLEELQDVWDRAGGTRGIFYGYDDKGRFTALNFNLPELMELLSRKQVRTTYPPAMFGYVQDKLVKVLRMCLANLKLAKGRISQLERLYEALEQVSAVGLDTNAFRDASWKAHAEEAFAPSTDSRKRIKDFTSTDPGDHRWDNYGIDDRYHSVEQARKSLLRQLQYLAWYPHLAGPDTRKHPRLLKWADLVDKIVFAFKCERGVRQARKAYHPRIAKIFPAIHVSPERRARLMGEFRLDDPAAVAQNTKWSSNFDGTERRLHASASHIFYGDVGKVARLALKNTKAKDLRCYDFDPVPAIADFFVASMIHFVVAVHDQDLEFCLEDREIIRDLLRVQLNGTYCRDINATFAKIANQFRDRAVPEEYWMTYEVAMNAKDRKRALQILVTYFVRERQAMVHTSCPRTAHQRASISWVLNKAFAESRQNLCRRNPDRDFHVYRVPNGSLMTRGTTDQGGLHLFNKHCNLKELPVFYKHGRFTQAVSKDLPGKEVLAAEKNVLVNDLIKAVGRQCAEDINGSPSIGSRYDLKKSMKHARSKSTRQLLSSVLSELGVDSATAAALVEESLAVNRETDVSLGFDGLTQEQWDARMAEISDGYAEVVQTTYESLSEEAKARARRNATVEDSSGQMAECCCCMEQFNRPQPGNIPKPNDPVVVCKSGHVICLGCFNAVGRMAHPRCPVCRRPRVGNVTPVALQTANAEAPSSSSSPSPSSPNKRRKLQ